MPGVILTHPQDVDLIALIGEVIAPSRSAAPVLRRAGHSDPGVRCIPGKVDAPISDAERAMWSRIEAGQDGTEAMEMIAASLRLALQDGTLDKEGADLMRLYGLEGDAVAATVQRRADKLPQDDQRRGRRVAEAGHSGQNVKGTDYGTERL